MIKTSFLITSYILTIIAQPIILNYIPTVELCRGNWSSAFIYVSQDVGHNPYAPGLIGIDVNYLYDIFYKEPFVFFTFLSFVGLMLASIHYFKKFNFQSYLILFFFSNILLGFPGAFMLIAFNF